MERPNEQPQKSELHVDSSPDQFDDSYPKNSVLTWLERFAKDEPTDLLLPEIREFR